jgi:hypothetical protein
MQNVPASVDPSTLQAALIARGIVADRGRYTPYAGVDAGNAQASALSGAVASQMARTAPAGGGAVASSAGAPIDNATNPNAPGSTALPISDDALDKMDEGGATALLVGLGLGGAALAAYLMRRRTKLAVPPADDIPVVEGEVLPPTPKVAGDHIVDGEVVEHNVPITNTKRITSGVTVPDNEGMKALGAPTEVNVPRVTNQAKPNRRTLAQTIAERSKRVVPNDVGTIPLDDAMNDLTPQELNQAETLMEQLRRNRKAGNAANVRRVTGERSVRSTSPTGTVERNALFNQVVRMIRQARIKPQALARAVP